MNDIAEFVKLSMALAPWREQLVFIGGWAHRLYRQHPLAKPPIYMALTTKDADVAFADNERLEGSIKEALENEGFKENLSGQHRPPVSSYTLGDDESGFYAEFLTPLRGSGRKRSGEADATLLKADITAQKLRHLEVLLNSPWQVSLPSDAENGVENKIELWIPNPVSFICQKILIRDVRQRDKQPQDVLYIHDTLELFGAQLPALAEIWKQRVEVNLTDKQRRDIGAGVTEMFSTITDTLRNAALIPQDRTLSPERMQAFCEAALEEMLG